MTDATPEEAARRDMETMFDQVDALMDGDYGIIDAYRDAVRAAATEEAQGRIDDLERELVMVARTKSPIRLGPTSSALASALTDRDSRIEMLEAALLNWHLARDGWLNAPIPGFESAETLYAHAADELAKVARAALGVTATGGLQ